jgi:hypothetical protein
MTPQQKAHVESLGKRFVEALSRKYEAGVTEHGGNLWDHEPLWLLDQALMENIDQFTYLSTLRDKLVENL